LSRHADEAYEELPTQRSKMIAEKVFKALAEKRPDNREVRRPTTVAGLCAIADASEGEVIAVIENFRRAGRSFLTPAVGIDLHADSMIDISHESLIRGWQRLRDWVEAEALSAGIYRRVAETAALYEKGDAGLWNDPDLQVALGWQRSVNPNQAWGERYHPGFPAAMNFLNESVAARDREFLEQEGQRVKELRRIRVFAAVLAVALILASALGVWAMTQRSRANQEAENARKEKQKAEAAKDEAEQARVAAVRSEGEAKKRRQEAEASKTLAEQRKREAEANLIAANAAKRTADENADAARKQKDIAEERNRKFISAVGNAEKQNQEDMGLLTSLYTELIARSSSQDSIKWRTWRAAALTSQGRHSEAEADLTKVLEATPDYDEARMTRGYMYMLTHRVPESIPDFDQVIANDPTSALAYLNRGLSEGIMGKYSDASSSIDNAIKNFRPGTYGSLSETQVSPAITRATGYRRIAADENSFQTALHYELGNIQAFTGRDDFVPLLQIDKSKSLSAYLTAINWAWLHMSIRDRDYGGWVSQGVMWEGLGPVYCGEAAFAYEQFQKNYSEHPDSRYQALSVLANRRKAGLHCPAAVPLPTDDLEALSLKADLAYDQNQYEEAERFLTKALALDKTNVDLLLRRAAARNILKKFADSKADADAVIGQVGDHPKALLYRALASDDTDVVESNLRQVLKDHPTNSDALFWLSKTLEEKNPNEAILLLDRATRLQPYSNALYFRKAHLQEKKGRYREALQSIERAITIDPYNTQYYDARASIEQHLAISPVQIARNLVEGYNQVADLLLKRGEAGPALDSYARSLKLIAVTAKSSGGGDAQCEMAEILHKIARLLEQQGASRDKTIKDLRFMFGDVKELESVLNAEVNALTKSP
jgi:tetratricopeptide (TPR) repeat protein